MKDAQTQRQVQMIQKMPSEIHSKVQNMLMPGSGKTAIARSSVADLEPTTDELEMREREFEGSTRHEDRTHKAFSRWYTARKALTGGLKRSRDRIQGCGDARTAVQETQKHSSAQQRNSARDTAAQEERSQLTAVPMDVHQPKQRSKRR